MDLITVAHKGGQRGACLREITCFVLTLSVDRGAQERMRSLDYPRLTHTLDFHDILCFVFDTSVCLHF